MGIPLVYYIAPQLWAWAPKRILKIKKTIKKVLVVFEFEKKLYEDSGIPVSWVGHPLKDIVEVGPSEDTGKKKQICLMPGSRADEVKKLLPIFLGAAERIRSALPHYSFVLIESPTLTPAHYEKLLKRSSLPDLSVISADAYAHIEQSELALVCSGTATLECALLKTPMIICNRASFFTYLIAKNVIRVPYLGLPNLVLNGPKFPEFLQYQATPQKIAESALKILSNPSMKKSMQENLDNVSQKLGTRGASIRAAQEILKEIA
jgi:lipid-A-disaccharide synthase